MSSKLESQKWGFFSCPPKPPIQDRPLITIEGGQKIEAIFKIFASTTRLRLLHALVQKSELPVNELAGAIGMSPQAVSNQLQHLVARGILGSRRDGNQVYYCIVDPCVVIILEHGLCLSEEAERRLT